MKLGLNGKVAIVTGSGKGIGRAIGEALIAEGVHTVIADIDYDLAKQTASELACESARCISKHVDVASSSSVHALVKETLDEFDTIDILINNAGMATLAPIDELTEAEWDRVININLKGTFLCSQAVLAPFKQQGSGNIVNFASEVIKTGANSPYGHYVAAKAGVWGLTMHLARHTARHGIRVNAVAPGATDTDFIKILPPDVRQRAEESAPLGGLARPEDIANAVVFLVSDAARFITGELIDINGGTTMD